MIFRNGPSRILLVLLVIVAAALITLDLTSDKFREGKSVAGLVVTPLQWFIDVPTRIADSASNLLVGRASLLAENDSLRKEALLLEQRVLQNSSLATENRRLRALLNARFKVTDDVQLAELIGVSSDPFRHEILINLGVEEGVFTGQPALDAGGVMGMVTSTAPVTSRVMLLTDSRAAIPVEVLRNGYRTIALGTGSVDDLKLDHIPNTADIRVGDLLITSGLAGAFPRGYPVAEISQFTQEPGQQFAVVRATPVADLNKSRYLLLVKMVNDAVSEEVVNE